MSKKFSKEPEKFGTGHVEGIVESGSANNSALAGAWIPALVFGIPGDSITAIVIGVLYMKNMNPGPTLFIDNPQSIYAVFLLFIVANLIMLPLGWPCIKVAKRILRVPRDVLMPVILLFCIVGAFAINNTAFDVGVMLVVGLVAWLLEENGFPITPRSSASCSARMLEENFITSMIKADGNAARVLRAGRSPAALGALTIAIWLWPLLRRRARAGCRLGIGYGRTVTVPRMYGCTEHDVVEAAGAGEGAREAPGRAAAGRSPARRRRRRSRAARRRRCARRRCCRRRPRAPPARTRSWRSRPRRPPPRPWPPPAGRRSCAARCRPRSSSSAAREVDRADVVRAFVGDPHGLAVGAIQCGCLPTATLRSGAWLAGSNSSSSPGPWTTIVPTAAPANHLPRCGDGPVAISATCRSEAASITRKALTPATVT